VRVGAGASAAWRGSVQRTGGGGVPDAQPRSRVCELRSESSLRTAAAKNNPTRPVRPCGYRKHRRSQRARYNLYLIGKRKDGWWVAAIWTAQPSYRARQKHRRLARKAKERRDETLHLSSAVLRPGRMHWLQQSKDPSGLCGVCDSDADLRSAGIYGLQVGPASTGLGWMLSVTNVSVTPYTASELFQEDSSVLASDNLKVSFGSHLIFAVRPDRVRELVEKFNNGQ
jgi:hypothetical protein